MHLRAIANNAGPTKPDKVLSFHTIEDSKLGQVAAQ
jgi:hypothetical protein